MTEAEALDIAAKAAVQMGWEYANSENLLLPAEYRSIRAHAKTIMENAALKAENERLRAALDRDFPFTSFRSTYSVGISTKMLA